MSEKPKHRWYQFSLRMLFVLVTIACIGAGWIAYRRNEVAQRRAAAKNIEAIGGVFSMTGSESESGFHGWDFLFGDDHYGRAHSIHLRMPVFAAQLDYMAHFPQVEELHFEDGELSNGALGRIRHLRNLKLLDCGNATLTDEDFREIAEHTELEKLYTRNTKVTDKGLMYLAKLSHLTYLEVNGSQASAEGRDELERRLPHTYVFVWLDGGPAMSTPSYWKPK